MIANADLYENILSAFDVDQVREDADLEVLATLCETKLCHTVLQI
jgi:hypothetical protein